MNNFEQIFKLSQTLEDQEKHRTLNWLLHQGSRLLKACQEFGMDTTELEKTINQLRIL